MDLYLSELNTAAEQDVPRVIQRLLDDESIYHFGRVLNSPRSCEFSVSEHTRAHWKLLELFSFGTLTDYKASAEQLPVLTPRLLEKLKRLTLVSLASALKVLHYDDLMRELDCTHEQQLEDLVIDAIYNELLVAKLDQQRRLVEVEYVVGRDVRREDLQAICEKLDKWSGVCKEELDKLAVRVEEVEKRAVTKRSDERRFASAQQELRLMYAASSSATAVPDNLARYDSQYASSEYQREERRTGAGTS